MRKLAGLSTKKLFRTKSVHSTVDLKRVYVQSIGHVVLYSSFIIVARVYLKRVVPCLKRVIIAPIIGARLVQDWGFRQIKKAHE